MIGSVVELSDVENGIGGFVINGVSAFSVSDAGDVNGDGFADLIAGDRSDDPNGALSGASYVVFGKADGDVVEKADIVAGTGGFVINGVSAFDFSGQSVSGAGDVNGDGLADLIVGAPRDANGASFVVFGKADGAVVELSNVALGVGGFVINDISGDIVSGWSVSGAGDVNGDGLADLIVGAPYADPNSYDSGASFVVFGKADGAVVDLPDVEVGTGGFVINGISASDQSGRSVSSAGDVNGDGFDDLIVGAGYADPNGDHSGASFVVFGKADGSVVELSDVVAGSGGFVINGVSVGDWSGWSVSGAGDVNGDGFDDLIVGAFNDDPNGVSSGASFVVFGKADGGVVELSDVEAGTGGFVINGVSAGDWSGFSVSGAGDVNGDGFDDLIVGAPPFYSAGTSYIIYGKADGGLVELSNVAAGVGGFVIDGVSAGDRSGFSVSGAGDVNVDGFADVVVSNANKTFVVFGGDFTGTTQIGTDTADALTGTEGNDVILGGPGDDTIDGGAGTDLIGAGEGQDLVNGGDGNDTVYASLGNDTVSGGTGNDQIFGWAGDDHLIGDAGDDTLLGQDDNDRIEGGDGNDQLEGGSGNDLIGGGLGNDLIWGGDGRDDLYGSLGNDTISGGAGSDNIHGGDDDDTVLGQSDDDHVYGDSGNDLLGGGEGNDVLWGWTGDDTLYASYGNDTVFGDSGNDHLYGWDGNDLLIAGAGGDILLGQAGLDRLDGGQDNDTLTGGSDADVFVFILNAGQDIVTDFEDGLDLIDLTAFGTTYDAMQSAISDDGMGGTFIDLYQFGGSGSIHVQGTPSAFLDADDFIFV
jgi:Ca2+-binding RTX toxin-like protein